MKRKIIRALSFLLILNLLIYSQGMVLAYAAESKTPDWLQYADGKEEEEITEEERLEQEKLEQWREKKKNIKVPILLYHHITNDELTEENSISLISPYDFRLHMTAIKTNFTPISLRQYCEYVLCDDGSVDIPNNPIIITFDDGYSSNYELGYPILKELNIPATIFVVTDTVGAVAGEGKVNYSHFTWEQAREMEASGLIEIQSHTVSHVKVDELNFAEQVRQLRKSKYDIEKNLGHKCDMIAFPYGHYDENVKRIAKNSGYDVHLLVDDKTLESDYEVNLPSEGLENLTRMTIAGNMGNVNVIEIIRRTMSKKEIQ
ncbi:MAG: polysaccharide deacetylase family protein [Monoglobaceae bacterium]